MPIFREIGSDQARRLLSRKPNHSFKKKKRSQLGKCLMTYLLTIKQRITQHFYVRKLEPKKLSKKFLARVELIYFLYLHENQKSVATKDRGVADREREGGSCG